MIAELLGHPLGAPPVTVGTHGRGDGLADLIPAWHIGACSTDTNKASAQTALVVVW